MATEQVRESLEKADESLRRAIAQLVEMRFGVPQCRVALDNAVGNLQAALSSAAGDAERDSLRPVVQNIRSHAIRVQTLLDSAATLHYGWHSVAPAGPDTYAPDGQVLRESGGGRLMLNA